jgi:serine protease Do
MLEELTRAVGMIAEHVSPSVVRVGHEVRGGSGVIVATDQVVTNAHNVHGSEVSVRFADGRAAPGRVSGVDIDGDVAVLHVETGAAPAVRFAEGPPGLGQAVFAVGATHRGPRVTFGLVSALGQAIRGPSGRRIIGSIEHTAPMLPGSSGSALVDSSARLVGLNTSRVGGGFYLALPADDALRVRIDALAAGKVVERPRLGVTVAPTWAARRMRAAVGLAPRDGVLVRDVDPESPAARAGILPGDLLLAVDRATLTDLDDLATAIETGAGSLHIDLVRGEQELSLTASIP